MVAADTAAPWTEALRGGPGMALRGRARRQTSALSGQGLFGEACIAQGLNGFLAVG